MTSDRSEAAPPQDRLSETLGYRFQAPALLAEALTHPSASARGSAAGSSYQRLEFLGDRVLGLIVCELLYRRFPTEQEGALARRLAALVSRNSLASVARALGLGEAMTLPKAEEEAGERGNPALLSDVCEAVIGALYLDGGLEAARAFVEPRWTPLLEADPTPPRDPKTTLQEWAQGRGLPLPDYSEVGREGPAHEPFFTMAVRVAGHAPAKGRGRSKRQAERAAAAALLAALRGAAS